MSDSTPGMVSIVGAGPGDPEFITRRGIRRLRRAEVVFHDKLSPNELIDRYCDDSTEVIDVGKRKGKVGPGQDQINDMLVRAAEDHRYVVRLKGGDPFLFGRGGEETGYLARHEVPFEVVPGVTSLLAAPAFAGIPLTHRELASEVGVITGHVDPDREHAPRNWDHLASLSTLVVMMGVTRSGEIAEQLIEAGRDPSTPVAIIGWATRAAQNVLTTTLEDLRGGLEEPADYLPGLIVIGEVVGCREELDWTRNLPLFGQKIVVTRPSRARRELSESLRELGAEVVRRPTIRIRPLDDGLDALREALADPDSYDGIILTSRNGVRMLRRVIRESDRDVRCLAGLTLACIGPGTAEELGEWGLTADRVPDEYRAEGLVDRLLEEDPRSWLVPRARGARTLLTDQLREAGHRIDEIHTYVSEPHQEGRDRLSQTLSDGPDLVTFTSSSTVDSLFRLFDGERVRRWLRHVQTACIGPITAGSLSDHGIQADIVSPRHDIPGLVRAIADEYDHPASSERELTGS